MAMVDRISVLPDEVLCHILSFLPTEDAVSTMILSKRWLKLWLYVPVLDLNFKFDDTEEERCSRFVTFVYTLILQRTGLLKQLIKTFRLESASMSFSSDHMIWVNAAVNKGVENLHLSVPYPTKSPCSSVFSCRTLVDLKLDGLSVNNAYFPDLPLLKTLSLSNIDFDEPRHLVGILNGCPSLEDLFLCYIGFGIISGEEGELKTLQKLVRATISDIKNYDPHLEAFCNVEYLFLGAVSLPSCGFPNLKHLTIEFDKTWNQVFEMLELSPKLQALEIQLPDTEIWDPDEPGRYYIVNKDMQYPSHVPECLSSQLRQCSLLDYKGVECELQFVKYILQNSKLLQTMRIQTIFYISREEGLEMLEELSTCPMSSATCEISGL